MTLGICLIEPTELYNILNQRTVYCALSDPNYLLLLDVREKCDYDESHVLTAKKLPMTSSVEFALPYDAQIECKLHVIVYDSNTRNIKDGGPAVECAKELWERGSRHAVKILRGGYEDFSALYPFLRTAQVIMMPRELDQLETYPLEILPGLLYLGNRRQANAKHIHKDLKIKAHINCTTETGEIFAQEGESLMQIPVEDTEMSDIYSKFQAACTFIDGHKFLKHTVLVYSDQGISRAAVVAIAYVMHQYKWSLQEAYEHTRKCCLNMRPIRAFIHQLSKWEEDVIGQRLTDVSDPNF